MDMLSLVMGVLCFFEEEEPLFGEGSALVLLFILVLAVFAIYKLFAIIPLGDVLAETA